MRYILSTNKPQLKKLKVKKNWDHPSARSGGNARWVTKQRKQYKCCKTTTYMQTFPIMNKLSIDRSSKSVA